MKKITAIIALMICISQIIFAQSWNTTGNTGTTPGTNFIGTTDAKDFVFKTNGIEKGRIKSGVVGWQFGTSGANLARIDSGGNLTFTGTAAYKVGGNKYAFQYAANPNYGLYFNAQSLLYEFRTSNASSVFSVGANSGNGIFTGNLKVGNSLTVDGTTSFLRMNASNSSGIDWIYSDDGYYNYVSYSNGAGSSIVANFAIGTEPYQFTVLGNMQANGFQSNSDRKLKTNIQPLSDVFSAIDVVEKLNPVTYDFKKDEYKIMNLPSQKQFGFIAQEIQQVLPNLVQSSNTAVSQDENGNLVRDQILSVNYIEVIPILTEAIQEQQKQIDDLKNQIQILSSDKTQMNDGTISLNAISTALLGQNVPNPFDNSTLIPFRIPKGCNSASIMITSSAEGKVITVIPVSCDENHISIDGGQLTTGTYTYSLIVDGVTISTRQMILTK